MIKLVNLLKEMYIDKQGNLVGEADFIILEGGMRGGIFKNKNQINVNDYINFTTKLNSFRKKDIANKIYKQIISIYNQSALKKYNDSIDFTPSLNYSKGGGWDMPSYSINLSNKLYIWGALEPSHFYPETGFDDFIKQMRKNLDINDSEFKDAENIKNQTKDSERFKDLDIKNLESKIEYIPIICIPKFEISGGVIDQFDGNIINKNFPMKDNHILYSKSDLLEDLNEIGLFLMSEGEKSNEINLTETEYTLYIVKPDAIYTGHYSDGSGSYKSHYRTPFIVLCKDDENWKDVLKRYHKSSYDSAYDGFLHPSVYIFGGETPHKTKNGIKMDTMTPYPPEVLKYKNVTISREEFNKLKNKVIYTPLDYGDKTLKEKFPELLNKLPKRNN